MKNIKYPIILLAILMLSWMLPKLSHLINDSASGSVFTYYSSVERNFVTIDYDDIKGKLIRKNLQTQKTYSSYEFDSILPMFYYRQLLADGRMPKEIHGVAVDRKQLREKSFFYRMSPMTKNTPAIPLYTLFESMSGRVNLKKPNDFFRLTDKITFLTPEDNTINESKSADFNRLFHANDFRFPARLVAGNPSDRKPYDEGYLILDSNNQLFHLKMVNGTPFIKNVKMPKHISPVFISTQEPADRSFYAFVYDKLGKVYLLTTNHYQFVEIPCPPYDINKDNLRIMANPLYWNVEVVNKAGKVIYALNASTKKVVDEYNFKNEIEKKTIFAYLFPFSIGFETPYSRFIQPQIYFNSWWSLISNIIFLIIFIAVLKIRKQKIDIASVLITLFTGIYGCIVLLIIRDK